MATCTIKGVSCPKAGNSPEENEDAFIAPKFATSENNIRLAVADGATESSFSREWADLLVCYFDMFRDFETGFFKNIFPALRKSWLQRIDYTNLEWYVQEKFEQGSFASLLGVNIDLVTGITDILAVGDSNFFSFRDGKMNMAFPLNRSELFGNRPFLISTEPRKNKTDSPFFQTMTLTFQPGDALVLATDALSHWILKETETGNAPVAKLKELLDNNEDPASFQEWLNAERNKRTIKNDDTTIVLIQTFD